MFAYCHVQAIMYLILIFLGAGQQVRIDIQNGSMQWGNKSLPLVPESKLPAVPLQQ